MKLGALHQLQQAIARNFGQEYSVMIKKILKVRVVYVMAATILPFAFTYARRTR